MRNQAHEQTLILVVVPAMGVAVPGQAHAYLDPASGSIILQAIVAALAGIAVAGRLYWSRLKSMFGFERKSKVIDDNQGKDNNTVQSHKSENLE